MRNESHIVADLRKTHFASALFSEAMHLTERDRGICRVIVEDFCDKSPAYDTDVAAAALEVGMIALSVHSMMRRKHDHGNKLDIGIIVLAGDVCLVRAFELAHGSGLMRASAALAHMLTSHSQARVLETRVASGSLCPGQAKELYFRYRYNAVVEAALIASGTDPKQPCMQALCARIGSHLAEKEADLSTLAAAADMLKASHAPAMAGVQQ